MSTELALIIGQPKLEKFTVHPNAIQLKEDLLSDCALIGKVTNADENSEAVKAMQRLQGLSNQLERDRKTAKEPLLDAGRQLDNAVNEQRDELNRERARIECLVRDFARIEQTRVEEERKRQELELQELERQKQAALAKAKTPEKIAAIEEKFETKSRIVATPIEATRQAGQSNRKVWKITRIEDFQLLKARPDLVRRIEWDMIGIKAELDRGLKLPGVTAEEDLKIGVRGRAPATVEV